MLAGIVIINLFSLNLLHAAWAEEIDEKTISVDLVQVGAEVGGGHGIQGRSHLFAIGVDSSWNGDEEAVHGDEVRPGGRHLSSGYLGQQVDEDAPEGVIIEDSYNQY